MRTLTVEGQTIPEALLQVELQPEVETQGYDEGCAILTQLFRRELHQFLADDLLPLGRRIIECCLDNGTAVDYTALIGGAPVFHDDD